MKTYKFVIGLVGAYFILALYAHIAHSDDKVAPNTTQVHMVITDQATSDDGDVPVLRPGNVQVKQGKDLLTVTQIVPARGDNAALQLMLLIDETCDSSIGNNLKDLRDFINAQPATTAVGVAYMSNASIQIAQNLTVDHALAAKAVRIPRGNLSTMDSPYLSLTSLAKGWPEQKVRREVLIITDGIDRLRGRTSSSGSVAWNGRFNSRATPFGTTRTMPSVSVDADSTSSISQRYGIIVHSIYTSGVGRAGRNAWEIQLGQSGIAKIADETGGEYYALGLQNPISFKPYLDRLQKVLDSQYYLEFRAIPRKQAGLQRVDILTEVANSDIAAADNVWVPARLQEPPKAAALRIEPEPGR